MTKGELIDRIYEEAERKNIKLTKKTTGELVDVVFDQVSSAIQGDSRFSYPNFGTFTVKHRKAREGRNPRTKKPITIPASNTVNFKPAPSLKDSLNDQ